MHLPGLDNGHRGRPKLFLGFLRAVTREDPPDVLKMLCYRPDFFGILFSRLVHAVLRGSSVWSVGERELFAAYTSRLNQCVF